MSAIKVFGYLEKPVFHELARHLQTRRLLAGETLNLDSDKSFYIVVDGSVQVFAQTGNSSSSEVARDAYDDEDTNGYQLLNNVENGGTLSSLFTILSSFTEDVKLRYEEEDEASPETTRSRSNEHDRRSRAPTSNSTHSFGRQSPSRSRSRQRRDPDVTDFNLDAHNTHLHRANNASSSSTATARNGQRPLSSASFATFSSSDGSTVDAASNSTEPALPTAENSSSLPIPSLDSINISPPHTPGFASSQYSNNSIAFDESSQTPSQARHTEPGMEGERIRSRFKESKAQPTKDPCMEGTIARATVDTTLAVIPAEAFRRLTKKFPNAAA